MPVDFQLLKFVIVLKRASLVKMGKSAYLLAETRRLGTLRRLSQRSNDWVREGTRAIYALPVTSGHFPVSSHKISTVNLLHSSHPGTKTNHSAPTNVLLPSFTA